MKKVLYVDMDGVLVDFARELEEKGLDSKEGIIILCTRRDKYRDAYHKYQHS